MLSHTHTHLSYNKIIHTYQYLTVIFLPFLPNIHILTMEQTPHIALLPSPGMGHLIPLTEFAKRLVHHHNISVTIIVPTIESPTKAQKAILENINHVFLPPISFKDEPDITTETQIFLATTRSLSSLRDRLTTLTATTRLVALVFDFFATDAFDVAKEFHIAPYMFFPSTAMSMLFCLHLPKLDQEITGEFKDLPEPVKIPGCVPIHGKDLMDPVKDRSNDGDKWMLYHIKRFNLAEGIIINSFEDLEQGAIKVLQVEQPGMSPIYPVGPLIQTGSGSESAQPECMQWLDDQPSGSVLFVSFGSGGTLSYDQLNELAYGLETSGQRFLWVVRSPNDKSANAAFFNVHSQNDPLGFLPKGFLDRTKGRGFVVSSWAPQIDVLRHGSTGGFLSHCGWNSTLESVVHGVPLIAWPLYAEQKMNAVMLTEDLKVALRPKVNEDGLIVREEITEVVKGLMEGEEGKKVRNRMRELKDAARKVLSEDGCSTKTISALEIKWKNEKTI